MDPMMEFNYRHPSRKAAFLSELSDQGVATFAIRAQPDSPIRGTELFGLVMRAFGDDVRAIEGVWRKGKGTGPSINIDKVNELTAMGIPLIDAIGKTWTVTRAQKYGFANLAVTYKLGAPGHFKKLDVMISK